MKPSVKRSVATASVPRFRAWTRPAVAATAAFAIAAAIGVPVGHYWFQSRAAAATSETADILDPASASSEPPVEATPADASDARTRTHAAPTPALVRDAKPAATASARARTAKKKQARAAKPPVRTTLVAAPTAARVALAASAPPPVVVASAPPPPPPPAPAVGPFFETTQVNQAPRVASQVEPRLPRDNDAGTDVVVLRVLVSQAGHASTIALLRRSKAGRDVDDAVVAAVKQWTFTPAMKRGQAVSCWFNVAVPLR